MIASLVGIGVSLLSAGWKAIQESRNNRKYQRERDAEYRQDVADTNARYNKRLYENPLSRADNQALLTHAKERLDDETRKATATARITGATPEAIQAQKSASANAYAQAVSNVVANNESRKDSIASEWEGVRANQRAEKNANRDADYKLKDSNIQKFGELGQQLGQTAAEAYANSGDVLNETSGTKVLGSTASGTTSNGIIPGGKTTTSVGLNPLRNKVTAYANNRKTKINGKNNISF